MIAGLTTGTTNLKNGGVSYAAQYQANQWDVQGELRRLL